MGTDMNNQLANLPRVYQVGQSEKGRPTIIIRRLPSQIPAHLDLALLRLAGSSSSFGPTPLVIYEFLLAERLGKAEEYLKGSMWERTEIQMACDRCSQGVMDSDNPHLHGICQCNCHRKT